MSSQKSEHASHVSFANTSPSGGKNGATRSRESIRDVDVYAAPETYYGSSHAPRKVAKSRTMSAVSAFPDRRVEHALVAIVAIGVWCSQRRMSLSECND
jgi:alpha,alpha-trehalase